MAPQSGSVIWITGLSGAGKSTIAGHVRNLLQEDGITPLLLDGDQFRDAINDQNCGHDYESRKQNAYRIARMAKLAGDQGITVLVATMSMFHEIHAWNRANLPEYFEVFLDVDLATLRSRDPKGLYARDTAGGAENMPGVDIKPEFPLAPHMRLKNNGGHADIADMADKVASEWKNRAR